jgi:hypothetical protein
VKLYQLLKLINDDEETIFILDGSTSIEIIMKHTTAETLLSLPIDKEVAYIRTDHQGQCLIIRIKG